MGQDTEDPPPPDKPETALVPRKPERNRTSAKKFKSAELTREIVALRIEGMSTQQIATQKGISKQAVHARLVKAMDRAKQLEQLEIDHWREISVRRYEIAIEEMLPRVREKDPVCCAQYLSAIEKMSKLLGLISPVKTELTGKDGGPVQVATTFANLLELARGAKKE